MNHPILDEENNYKLKASLFGCLRLTPSQFDLLMSKLKVLGSYQDKLDYWLKDYKSYLKGYTGTRLPPLIITKEKTITRELNPRSSFSFLSNLSSKDKTYIASRLIDNKSYGRYFDPYIYNNLSELRNHYITKLNQCIDSKKSRALGLDIPLEQFEDDCKKLVHAELLKQKEVASGERHTSYSSNISILLKEFESSHVPEEMTEIKIKFAGQKVMLADKLGLIDFLYERNVKIDQIASLLASMLGEEAGTIRAVIVAIRNKENTKNNPYSAEKNKKWLNDTLARFKVSPSSTKK